MNGYERRMDRVEHALGITAHQNEPLIVFVIDGDDAAAKIAEAKRARGIPEDDLMTQVFVVRWVASDQAL
jgi:hypothetical protein